MRKLFNEAGLWLIGIPVFLWTVIPIYHMALFAFSSKDSAFGGNLFPTQPTLRNFEIVVNQQHHFLNYFWSQFGSSVIIAFGTGALTSFSGRTPGFSRLRRSRVPRSRSNCAAGRR